MIYNNGGINLPFGEFFAKYSELAVCSGPSGSKMMVEGSSELAKRVNEFEKKRRELRGKGGKQNPYKTPDFYDKSPFTSISNALLRSLKENLIKELIIISQYTTKKDDFVRNKERKVERTFKKFSQTKVEINSVKKIKNPEKGMSEYLLFRPYHHEIIASKYPDFDVYIEDNIQVIAESIKNLANSQEKLFVLPDYKSCHKVQGPNVYHVKTTVSDITDRDFALGSLELKTKQLEKKEIKEEVNKKSFSPFLPTLLLGGWFLVFLILFLLITERLKKQKKY